MKCPMCGNRVKKARLDVYWCQDCRRAWLIHGLSTYKTFEEASETNYEAQLKQDFLSPLIGEIPDVSKRAPWKEFTLPPKQ